MFAIITRPREDGTYDEVGTNNRYATSHYTTERGLLRYGIASYFHGRIRIELFATAHSEKPYKTMYVER